MLPEGQLGSAGVGVRSVGSAGIPFDAVVESAVERAFDAVDEPLIPGAALSFTPLWFLLALRLAEMQISGLIVVDTSALPEPIE